MMTKKKTADDVRRVRLTSDRLNSYGTRVLTRGMDVDQYKKNPVLLYMHERGTVIGYVDAIEVSDEEVTGVLVFDEASELSRVCKAQWDFGSLKMVSVGIDIVETSEDPALLVAGQTRPTVTKSKLYEVSLVDIGANDDAIVLRKKSDGRGEMRAVSIDAVLPLLHCGGENIVNPINQLEMEKKETVITKSMALLLGLPEGSDMASVEAAVVQLQTQASRVAELENELATLRAAEIESLVDAAIGEHRLSADKKAHFVELGKQVGAESLKATLDAMEPQVKVKVSELLNHAGADGHVWEKLSDVPSDELAALKERDPEQYKKLYKAKYGMEMN